jgi:branched-chain amino acid transport system permease protein
VGLLDALVGTWLVGPELKLSFALAIIVAVLLVRPAGLFGRATVSRV